VFELAHRRKIEPNCKNEEDNPRDWSNGKSRQVYHHLKKNGFSHSIEPGGSVAKLLLQYPDEYELRCLTRDLASKNAKALAERGALLVRGDLTDPTTLSAAVEGCWGVLAVTNFYDAVVTALHASRPILIL
jgi:hypothetical protein